MTRPQQRRQNVLAVAQFSNLRPRRSSHPRCLGFTLQLQSRGDLRSFSWGKDHVAVFLRTLNYWRWQDPSSAETDLDTQFGARSSSFVRSQCHKGHIVYSSSHQVQEQSCRYIDETTQFRQRHRRMDGEQPPTSARWQRQLRMDI